MILRYCFIGCLLCCACNNIEDAKPAERNTFIRFYEAPHAMHGVAAEPANGGYIILANETLANGNQNSLLITTDKNGNRITPDVVLPNGISRSLKVITDGYYVIGDSIRLNTESSQVPIADFIVTSARLFKIDFTGTILKRLVIADKVDSTNITDIHGGSITLNAQNQIVILGTLKPVGLATKERPFLTAIDPVTFDTVWTKTYNVIDRDYVNSKSVHIAPSGRIVWATALLKDNQNFSRSYITIPYIKENSTFENASEFGGITDQRLYPNDIQPAKSTAFGYAVVGTYASPTGAGSNMFFIRVDQYGSIIEGSAQYFDGELSAGNQPVTSEQSASDDTGDALTATKDGGFVLAGSMLTTPNRGKGGKDIFLIKVDGQGTIQWNKILGGAGDETVNSIRETDNGGLLICGTNNVSGLPSVFVMQTDGRGELKN